ncbi:MAG: leucyl/phenylalanyl-tRNA--protein transferase, partial [Rhodobacteraceae bacterium]|nr:leucyl/phenylalanyl-tRNA--protein transferase [Paracoccaceae bacterium]
MADGRNSQKIHWVEPRFRGIFPMDRFHISRSLSRKIHQRPFRVTLNTAFSSVIRACADRDETWINQTIEDSYTRLHREGHAHSIEIWDEAELVGGVYGIA